MAALGTALAIGKLGFAAGKRIAAAVKKKRAMEAGAALRDPNEQALLSAMKRKKRQLEVGSSQNRAEMARNMRNLSKTAVMSGNRGGSAQLSRLMSDIESNISREEGARAQQQDALIEKQTGDIADRKMDLIEADKYQRLQDAAVDKNTSSKNIQSSMPGAKDEMMDSMGQGDQKNLTDAMQNFKKKRGAKKALNKGFRGAKKAGFTGKKADFEKIGGVLSKIGGMGFGK
jgi:hypothetical protein